MNTFSHFSDLIRHALGAHQLLRQFGYPGEEVFLNLPRNVPRERGLIPVFITLQHGGREISIVIGETSTNRELITEQWMRAGEEFNVATEEERQFLLDCSPARHEAVNIIASLIFHGFGTTPEQIEERRSGTPA